MLVLVTIVTIGRMEALRRKAKLHKLEIFSRDLYDIKRQTDYGRERENKIVGEVGN